MGLQKEIEYGGTGIMLNYWRINCVTVDIEAGRTVCRVGGYIEKADALAGKKAVSNVTREFVGAANPITLATDPREYQNLLYAKLIEAPVPLGPANQFQGATIVSDAP
jgi:hypothetical protein